MSSETKQLQNVIYIGVCFTVLFSAEYTISNTRKTLMASIHDDKPEFTVDGNVSLAILFFAFAVGLWLGPSIISIVGLRTAMALGAAGYTVLILSINTEENWVVYTSSCVCGITGGVLWTGEGDYIIRNSTPQTVSRNFSIFWAFLQISAIFGNGYTYYRFQGKRRIDGPTRRSVIYVFGAICGVSVIMFVFLRPVEKASESKSAKHGPIVALKKMWKIFSTKYMLTLMFSFIYAGLQHAFSYSVYGNSVGFTESFGNESKQLLSLSCIFLALGEVIVGGILIIFSSTLNRFRHKRTAVFTSGIVSQLIAYVIIYINLPNDSVFGETSETSYIKPNATLAVISSFLLGVGDCTLNTQVYSLIAIVFPNESRQSSALFKLVEYIFVSIGLYSSRYLCLHEQLIGLAVCAVIGLISYIIIDVKVTAQLE